MPLTKKSLKSWAIPFIIWITASSAVFAVEWIYVSPIIGSRSESFIILNALTLAASLGLRQYFIAKKHTRSESSDRRARGAILDSDLSKQYSEEGRKILGRDLEIYRIFDQRFSKSSSPAFSIMGKTPRIFVSGAFFGDLNSDERRALIVHEIGHYLHKDFSLTYLLTLLFALSIGSFFITLTVTIFNGLNQLDIGLLLSFIIASIPLLLALRLHLLRQEYRADKFVIKVIKDSNAIKVVIKKSYSYAKLHRNGMELRKMEKSLNRRLKHLES
ncbi:MAG: M48 family metalloprotease [Thermoplasmatales archaeon]